MADVVRVRLLGGFEASSGERNVARSEWRLRKARTLVKLLAVAPGHALRRDQLIDALWPDLDPVAGRNNLNQVVHAARRALATLGVDGADVLVLQDELLTLGGQVSVITDVEELQAAVGEAFDAGRPEEVAELLRAASAELLPEDAYERWVQTEASNFREWRARVAVELSDRLVRSGAAGTAVVLLTPLVNADPMHEPAARAMMRALAADGRRAQALQLYEALRDALLEDLGAEPEPTTKALFRELLTGPAPTTVVVPAPRLLGNLPAPVTRLVGRERELREIRDSLDRTRLLTLTGLGGAGKTTLAVELGRRCTTDYPGGVHLIELGSVMEAEQVAPRIAHALQLEVPAAAPALTSIVMQLREQSVLLILDNCEHLLDACARAVTEILRGCPSVRVVATSREPLRIDGEIAWRTPSLELPDLRDHADLQALSQVASVELFVQRAAAATHAFRLAADNADAVAEICYRLDGIPLALELAAACTPMMSARQIADRLNDALSLLRRGGRAGITRQQTLAATLAWSHDLLTDDERVLFRRLAVFAGSFSLDAVEAVCAGDDDTTTALSAVARLVDTSMLIAETHGATTRYRLLDTVRQYAAEQQRQSGEQASLKSAHCRWYLQVARMHDPDVAPGRAVVLGELDVDHDNMRAALAWALPHEPSTALDLSVALSQYWLVRGFFAEARRWLEAALAAATAPSAVRARALLVLAVFDVRRGFGDRLAQLGAEAVRIRRGLGAADGIAQALAAEAALAFMRGDWRGCWRRTEEAHALALDSGALHVAAAATHLQGIVRTGQGRVDDARTAFTAVRDALPSLPEGTPAFLPPVLMGFSVETTPEGRLIFFEETVLAGRLVTADRAEGYVLCNLADVCRLEGNLDDALLLLRDAAARFAAIGDSYGQALATSRRGCLHRVRGEFDEARAALRYGMLQRQALGDRRAITLSRSNLGVLVAMEGDYDLGRRLVLEAIDSAREIQDVAAVVGFTATLASVDIVGGHPELAEPLLREFVEYRHLPGYGSAGAWGYAVLADVLRQRDKTDEADAALAESRRLARRLGAGAQIHR